MPTPINQEVKYWNSISAVYDRDRINPLVKGVKNPLWKFVEGLENVKYERVVDFGCGNGKFAAFLSKYFREVWAIEFSDMMLEIAKARYNKPNIIFRNLDMRDLKVVYDTFDIAFSINSILPSNPNDVPIMFNEIYKSVHSGGLFVAILPSFDTILYLRDLTFEEYRSNGMCESDAKKKVEKYFISKNKMNEEFGLYADDGVKIQKFLQINKIKSILPRIGFKIERIDKVLYPWELSKKHGYGYFPTKPEIWDWFVVATKTV